MSDYLRYLVTVDAASGEAVRVEQVGEAGDLNPVDLPAFLRSLGAGSASPQPQVVVNIYGGGTAMAAPPPGPPPPATNICYPPPVAPPPDMPAAKKRPKR